MVRLIISQSQKKELPRACRASVGAMCVRVRCVFSRGWYIIWKRTAELVLNKVYFSTDTNAFNHYCITVEEFVIALFRFRPMSLCYNGLIELADVSPYLLIVFYIWLLCTKWQPPSSHAFKENNIVINLTHPLDCVLAKDKVTWNTPLELNR